MRTLVALKLMMSKSNKEIFLACSLFFAALAAALLIGCELGPPIPVKFKLGVDRLNLRPSERGYVEAIFEIEPGWHIYSRDVGPYARPTTMTLSVPPKISANVMEWPSTVEFVQPGGVKAHGYAERLILTAEIAAAEGPHSNSVQEVVFSASWLACEEICVPGKAQQRLVVAVVK